MKNNLFYLKHIFIILFAFSSYHSSGQSLSNRFSSDVFLDFSTIEKSSLSLESQSKLMAAVDSVNNSLRNYLNYLLVSDSLRADVKIEIKYSSALGGAFFFTFKNRYNSNSVQGFVYKESQIQMRSVGDIYESIIKPYRICLSFFVIDYNGRDSVKNRFGNSIFAVSFRETGNLYDLDYIKRVCEKIENIVIFHSNDFCKMMNIPTSVEAPININVKFLMNPEAGNILNKIQVSFKKNNNEITEFELSLSYDDVFLKNPFIWLSKINEKMKEKMLECILYL